MRCKSGFDDVVAQAVLYNFIAKRVRHYITLFRLENLERVIWRENVLTAFQFLGNLIDLLQQISFKFHYAVFAPLELAGFSVCRV